jgi:NADH dehydrogenase [ubiquinone] 1 alpha subcomplex assembly factor 1
MSENQISMLRERIRSVGISLLGGNSGVEGKYELGIDSIKLVNEEDVDPSSKFEPSFFTVIFTIS